MTLATVRPDGYPQATTVSYVNDGFTLYFGASHDSQKALNIAQEPKVSLTVNRPFRFWKHIVGLSAAGRATAITDSAEYRHASGLLFKRFPEVGMYRGLESGQAALYRVSLEVISLLDYRRGMGHVTQIDLPEACQPAPNRGPMRSS